MKLKLKQPAKNLKTLKLKILKCTFGRGRNFEEGPWERVCVFKKAILGKLVVHFTTIGG
jgi:hypothetical protein